MCTCVQLPSHVWFFATPWTAARQASLSLTISGSLPKFMSVTLVTSSSHLILWRHLLLLPSIFPSIRDLCNESAVRWPKYWMFQHQSFQWVFRVDFPWDWLVWSPCCLGLSRVFSSTTVRRHRCPLALCLLYGPAFTAIHGHWEDHILDNADLCQKDHNLDSAELCQSNVSAFQHIA